MVKLNDNEPGLATVVDLLLRSVDESLKFGGVLSNLEARTNQNAESLARLASAVQVIAVLQQGLMGVLQDIRATLAARGTEPNGRSTTPAPVP